MRNEVDEALIEMAAAADEIRQRDPELARMLDDMVHLVKDAMAETANRISAVDRALAPQIDVWHLRATELGVGDSEASECPF